MEMTVIKGVIVGLFNGVLTFIWLLVAVPVSLEGLVTRRIVAMRRLMGGTYLWARWWA